MKRRSLLLAILLLFLFVPLHFDSPDQPAALRTDPAPIPHGQGGPHWQREFFARMHQPYPAELEPDHLERIWKDVAAVPGESSDKTVNTWELLGPSGIYVAPGAYFSGRVLDIDAVTRPETMVAAASGGLWGRHLVFPICRSGGINSQWIGSFAVDPNNLNTILVGTGEPFIYSGTGLWKTVDGGQTWEHKSMFPSPGSFFRVRYGVGGTTVHAATRIGYFRSTDGGDTWSIGMGGTVTDIALHPTDPNVLYATVWNQGLFLTLDGGLNWNQITTSGLPTNDVSRGAVSVCAANPGVIYVAFAHETADGHVTKGIYRTGNYGFSWTDVSPGYNYMNGQGWYDNVIAVCPTDPNVVLAGGVPMLRTEDGGQTWTQENNEFIHGDHHAIQWHPDGQRVWVGHDGGWSYSPNQGQPGSWLASGNQLPITQFVHMDVWGLSWPTAVIGGGSQDNGVSISIDGGDEWYFSHQAGGDAGGFNIVDETPNVMYMANGYYSDGLAFIPAWSIDSGVTWTHQPDGLPDSETFYPSMRLDSENRVYIYYDRNVYFFHPVIHLWLPVSSQFTPTDITEMTVCTVPGERIIYACCEVEAGGGVQIRVLDQLEYFEERSGGLPADVPIKKVVPDPTDSYRAYALVAAFYAAGEKLFVTTDRGVNWTNITGNLPNVPFSDLIAHPDDPQQLFLGTEFGIFRTSDGGMNWEHWDNGMPTGAIVTEMRYMDLRPSSDDLYIVAATYGRSIWKRGISGEDPIAVGDFPGAEGVLAVQGAAPNPFNALTRMVFTLDRPVHLKATVYDQAGRRLATLTDEEYAAGDHELRWDGRDADGLALATGMYLVHFVAGDEQETVKVSLVK